MAIRVHVDDPELLREAFRYSAAATGFSDRMIEKDYFCSVALEDLAESPGAPVFKGGTCLAKIHGDFHRLSEDLDFSIGIAVAASRTERSRAIRPFREHVARIGRRLPGVRLREPLAGSNGSRQYNGILEYASLFGGDVQTLRIEVELREPILDSPPLSRARTVVINPARGGPLIDEFPVRCLSKREAIAEKLRAALTRREVAIRDFFDVDRAVQMGLMDPADEQLLRMLGTKLAIPGNPPVDLSGRRLDYLRSQIETDLRPVLRTSDLEDFQLERVIAVVQRIGDRFG